MFPLLVHTEHTTGIQKLFVDWPIKMRKQPPSRLNPVQLHSAQNRASSPAWGASADASWSSSKCQPSCSSPSKGKVLRTPCQTSERDSSMQMSNLQRPRRIVSPPTRRSVWTQRYILNGSQYYPTTLFTADLRKSVEIPRVINEEEP